MDAASKLLSAQFPHMQDLQSSLRYQTAGGLIPITFSGGFVPEGLSQTVIEYIYVSIVHDNYEGGGGGRARSARCRRGVSAISPTYYCSVLFRLPA